MSGNTLVPLVLVILVVSTVVTLLELVQDIFAARIPGEAIVMADHRFAPMLEAGKLTVLNIDSHDERHQHITVWQGLHIGMVPASLEKNLRFCPCVAIILGYRDRRSAEIIACRRIIEILWRDVSAQAGYDPSVGCPCKRTFDEPAAVDFSVEFDFIMPLGRFYFIGPSASSIRRPGNFSADIARAPGVRPLLNKIPVTAKLSDSHRAAVAIPVDQLVSLARRRPALGGVFCFPDRSQSFIRFINVLPCFSVVAAEMAAGWRRSASLKYQLSLTEMSE